MNRRRRQAAYIAIGSGLGLLRPMLRRVGVLVGLLAGAPLVAAYLRLLW